MAELLDHDFDGIQEYDNPIPTWLGALFAGTIAFGLGYALYYPSLPNYQGISGWSASGQYDAQVQVEEAKYAPLRAEAEKKVLEALASLSQDPATVAAGKAVYAKRCAPCHGENAEGRVGPNLTDNTWIYGGDPKSVLQTIREGRPKGMPKWKNDLSAEDIQNVAAFVLSLAAQSGSQAPVAAETPVAATTPAATETPATETPVAAETPEATETPTEGTP